MLKRNVGELDRLLRVILGLYALLMGFLFIQGVAGIIIGIIGGIILVTGLLGWCPLYHLLKKSTFKESTDVAASQPATPTDVVAEVTDETAEETVEEVLEETDEVTSEETPAEDTDAG